MKRLIMLALMLAPVCAHADYKSTMQTWIGHGANELVSSWGYPATTYQIQGGIVYGYQVSLNYQFPDYQMPQYTMTQAAAGFTFSNTSGGMILRGTNVRFFCETYFQIDGNGIIQNVSWQGNSCR